MKNFFARAPLVRLLIPFVAGIVAAIALHWRMPLWPALFLLLLCCGVLLYFLRKPLLLLKYPGTDGWLIHVALAVSGFCLTGLHSPDLSETYFAKQEGRELAMIARVTEQPAEKETSVKLLLEVLVTNDRLHWQQVTGKLLCYLRKNPAAVQLKYGDVLLLRARPEAVRGPMNPGEFDYRRYLAMHGVYHQCFGDSASWKRIAGGFGHPVKAEALRWREKLIRVFGEQGLSGQELAVASALILGDDDRIDPGLIRAYSASGALHVLSVSGLHVAVIYIVFNLLLGFLERFPGGKWIKAVVLVLLLWAYAALTGFSPSVLRSSAMFSFVVIGDSFRRKPGIFNTLAASAFLLLITDPYLLTDVGFQLSYLAVAGIVTLQPLISAWYEPGNRLMRQVWGITAVSIAAQLATFPVGFYYFHQFPTYFLLANLVVIPLSTLVIYCGVATLIFSAVPYLSLALAWLLNLSVQLLNGAVQLTEQMPGAVIGSGHWSLGQTLLLYFLLLYAILFLVSKKLRHLQLFLVSTVVLAALVFVNVLRRNGQEQLVVYSLQKHSALGFISGRTGLVIADSSFLQQDNGFSFHIQPHQLQCSVTQSTQRPLETDTVFSDPFVARQEGLLAFKNRYLYVAGRDKRMPRGALPPVDLLLLTANTRIPLDSLLEQFHPLRVAADGSNSRKHIEQWQQLCSERRVPFYDVREKGALVIEY